MILPPDEGNIFMARESAWFKRCDEILRRRKCKRAPSDAPFIISASRSVAILQFISVSVYRAAQTPAVIIPSWEGIPLDGHIKFLIKRWIDRNKWKDAVFEPAERPEEKSVSAVPIFPSSSPSLLPANYITILGTFLIRVPLSTERAGFIQEKGNSCN